MAHMFESGFVVKLPAWHGLATVLDEPPRTGGEAMQLAGCDWRVLKRPLWLAPDAALSADVRPEDQEVTRALDCDELLRAPAYATVRETDGRLLGVVGEQYQILQNRDAFQWFDPFLEDGTLEYVSGGSLWRGERIFAQTRVRGVTGTVVGSDQVEGFLLLSNSHDGSLAIDVRFTPVRVVCHNTLSVALGDGEAPHLSLRHTRYSAEAMKTIRATVDLTRKAFEATMDQFRLLARCDVKGRERIFIREVMETERDNKTHERKPFRHENRILELAVVGEGNDVAGVRGTWWAMFNGLTQWIDRERGQDENRMGQSWYGAGKDLRDWGLELALDYASGRTQPGAARVSA